MKGWYVDKTTGAPLCWTTKGDKPSLAGHPFVAGEMPDGNDPFKESGTPYKRGPSAWVKDDAKIAERDAKKQADTDKKTQRTTKIAQLKGHNNKDIADIAALLE